ncbi:MAG: hypothetical protein GQ539_13325 [Sulfitobacter sp.]|nr:hypothetical protein [Sulfitobacter sp.]
MAETTVYERFAKPDIGALQWKAALSGLAAIHTLRSVGLLPTTPKSNAIVETLANRIP